MTDDLYFKVAYANWTKPKEKLTSGQIAGIVIGAVAFIAGIVAIIFACKGLFIIIILSRYGRETAKNQEMNSDKLEERNESSDILQDVLQKTAERVENLKLI